MLKQNLNDIIITLKSLWYPINLVVHTFMNLQNVPFL